MTVNRTFDLTGGQQMVGQAVGKQANYDPEIPPAALLQPKPKINWNPFSYLWTGMQYFAYFFAPPNECVYCWLWRMFFVGAACGAAIVHWWPK